MSRRQKRRLWHGNWGQFTNTHTQQEQQQTRLQPTPQQQEQVIATESESRTVILKEQENSHSALQQEHQKIQQANLISLIAAEKAKREALQKLEVSSRLMLKIKRDRQKPQPKKSTQSESSPSAGFFKVDPLTQAEKKLAEQKPAEASFFWRMLGY